MIAFVDGAAVMVCDWCYARAPKPEDPNVVRSHIPVKPKRWGIAMVVYDADRTETRHACPSHTRSLRAWERAGIEGVVR